MRIWKKTSIIALILLFVFTITYGIKDRTVALPDNPITEEVKDSSKVYLTGKFKDILEGTDEGLDEDTENEKEDKDEEIEEEQEEQNNEKDENEEVEEEQEEQEENEETQEKDVKNKATINEQQKESGKDKDGARSDKAGGSTNKNNQEKDSETYKDVSGDRVDDDSPNIDLNNQTDDNGKKNDYFTTTITDGEVVTESDYDFRIIHKENDYRVELTEVFLNGKLVKKFNGQVTLKDEENIIDVKVIYENDKKETFTVTRSYTVYLIKDEIVITTDLEDGKVVENESFTFKAESMLGNDSIPLTITHNENTVEENDSHQYEVVLQEGTNTFTLSAEAKGIKEEQSYEIIYEKRKETEVVIETDVKDETVSDPNYSFYAIAKADGNEIDVKTTVNGEEISGDGRNYTIRLDEGENTLAFEANYEGKTASAQYKVTYAKPDGGNEDEDVEQEIKLRISDLADGQTIKNNVHTFNVEAIDEDGNRLTGKGISISASNNGESIPINWSNDAHNSFTMDVQDGTNNIIVTAKDKDGNMGTVHMTIHGEVAGEGEPIGHITLSLEATTVGLGHLIPATQVELYANERGSETIDRIFEQYGITYEYTGNHADSFYLSHLSMPGLYDTKPKVPDDLAEIIGDRLNEDQYIPPSLGEFDFTNTAGWMYSVNGTYPNVGFADYYFKDGDTVRIRFTLALGADIGGGSPGTNFGKEW